MNKAIELYLKNQDKNGSASVLISDFKTPEQIRALASLKEEDLRKVGNLEIADLKGGKAIVFSQNRSQAKIEDYDGNFKDYLAKMEGRVSFVNIEGSDYNVLDGKDDFGTIQAASRGQFDLPLREREFAANHEGLRKRLSDVLQRRVDSGRSNSRNSELLHLTSLSKNTSFDLVSNIDGETFHDVFEIARAYTRNGELVDLHDNYKNVSCYVSTDGLSGFAITKRGDLISVYNAGNKRGFIDAVSSVIQDKAKTLDCYVSTQQNLQEIYEKKLGFKTVALMDWNDEYDHDDIRASRGKPKVAFMVNPKFATREIELKTFGKDEYDKAKAWQMSFITSPKEGVEAKHGKDVSKAPASLVIEASSAKESKTHNLTNTAKTINKSRKCSKASSLTTSPKSR